MESEKQMKKIIKNISKKMLVLLIAFYAINTFISQQRTLNAYTEEVANCETEIKKEKENKQSLLKIKENVNSPEYIEQIARERLGMYLPNEKVYIDITK